MTRPRPAEPTTTPTPSDAPAAGADGGATAAGAGGPWLLDELPSAGEFTRLALWMAGALAGVTTPTHAALGRHFHALARRLGWPVRGVRVYRPGRVEAMSLLADAVVGTGRLSVASVFGAPRCAVTADGAVATDEDVWLGQTWYYPVSSPAASAVAVEFEDEQASRVVFVKVGRAA